MMVIIERRGSFFSLILVTIIFLFFVSFGYRLLGFDSNNLLVNLDPYYHKQDTNHVEKKNKTQISKY
jgi:asparagine N-glycosylation enzyme membrane subunit Stt3